MKSRKSRENTLNRKKILSKGKSNKVKKIPERKTAQQKTLELAKVNEALRKSEATLRSVFAASPAGILVVTSDRKISWMNERITSITGYTLKDIQEKGPQIFYADDEEFARIGVAVFQKVLLGGTIEEDTRWICKDGNRRDIHLSVAPIDPNDASLGQVSIVTDITDRKTAEETLRESENKFRDLAEKALVGIYVVQNRIFKYVNERCAQIHGCHIEELAEKKSPRDFVLPEDLPIVTKNLQARMEGHVKSLHHEFRILTKSKEIRYVETFGTHTTYQGKPATIGTIIDITERKQAEEALSLNEKRFRALVEKSSEAVFLDNRERKRTYVTPSITTILGYSVKEFLSMDRNGFIHPDDTSKMETARLQILANPGETVTFANRLRHKDGNWRWVESTIQNLLDEPGVQSLVAHIHDITERIEAEEALKESENKFRDLVEKSFVGIYIIQNKVFKYANARFAEIHGYTVEEIVNKRTTDEMIFLEDLSVVNEATLARASGSVMSLHYEFRIVTKAGEIKYIEVYGTRSIIPGKPATIGAVFDITELKKIE